MRGGSTGVPLAVGICPHHTFIAASKYDSPCDFRLGSPPLRRPGRAVHHGSHRAKKRVSECTYLYHSDVLLATEIPYIPPICIGRSGLRLKPEKPQPDGRQADGNCPPRAPLPALFPRSEAASNWPRLSDPPSFFGQERRNWVCFVRVPGCDAPDRPAKRVPARTAYTRAIAARELIAHDRSSAEFVAGRLRRFVDDPQACLIDEFLIHHAAVNQIPEDSP